MEAEERGRLTAESNGIRQELKNWEREFAAANGGKKASREDIKQNPSIAQKYKDYNRVRDVLSGKAVPQTSAPSSPRPSKRKRSHTTHTTPSKRRQLTQTPVKATPIHPSRIDPYDSPSIIRTLFTPSKPIVIGPTPQKDGQVLGLFDIMPSSAESNSTKALDSATKVQATPRKSSTRPPPDIEATPSHNRHSRTPLSKSSRFLLDSFVTPLKRRGSNDQASPAPSSVSKLQFSTPSFLRRDNKLANLPAIPEAAFGPLEFLSPEVPRFAPRKPLVRGLSSMLAGLRQIQEEALDDDLDVLREMENETSTTAPRPPKSGFKSSSLPTNNTKMPEVQVEDSQVRHFPLGGFDDEGQYDSEPEDPTAGLDRNGQPLPVYKKRGQKRTTRKVNMKPVRAKLAQPKPSSFAREYDDTDDEEEYGRDGKHGEEGAPDLIPDTQHPGFDSTSLPLFAKDDDFDPESSGSEYTASNGGTRYRKPDQSGRRSKRMAGKVEILGGKAGPNADAEGDGEKEDGKEGMVEKAKTKMRKVGTQVSANYKRLKLRNTGAKGGRVGGRFGKRR